MLEKETKRWSILPIKHMDLWTRYKNAQKQNWVAEEIDLSKDHFHELSEKEQVYLKNLLAFFAVSDGIVIENLAVNFLQEVDIPEAQFFYGFQTAIESVHCVSGNTLILTDKGYFTIKSMVNSFVNVWNGEEYSKVNILKTSDSAQMYKVLLTNGSFLECTSGHKWIIRKGNQKHPENCTFIKVETKDLKIGDVLYKFDTPIINGTDELKYPYTHGFFCGDGGYINKYPNIKLYGEKKKLYKYLEVSKNSNPTNKSVNGRVSYYLNKDISPKYTVPINCSVNTKLRWLEGYCDADGTVKVYKNKFKGTAIQLVSINFDFLHNVKLMLQTLGVQSQVKLARDASYTELPDGRGGKKYYQTKKCYVLYITATCVTELINIGFSPKRLSIQKSSTLKHNPQLVRIKSIEPIGIEPSYCFNEPIKNNGVFNGILTGQSEMYGLLVDTYIKDPIEKDMMFNAVEKIPAVANKAEWAIKWIKSPSFVERLIAFACVEGIAFSSTFAGIFWYRSRNKMPGLCNANELILRDENSHYEFANYFYNNYVEDSNKIEVSVIKSIILGCYEAEKVFVENTMPSGLDGLSKDDMIQYVKYVTDTVLMDFGCGIHFGVSNPLDYMNRISLQRRGNFFESRGNNDYTRVDIPTGGIVFDEDF